MRFINGEEIKVNIRFPNDSFYTSGKLHPDKFKVESDAIFENEVFGWYGDEEDEGIYIGMKKEDWSKIERYSNNK